MTVTQIITEEETAARILNIMCRLESKLERIAELESEEAFLQREVKIFRSTLAILRAENS